MLKATLAIYGLAAFLGAAGQLNAAQVGSGKRVVIDKSSQTLRAYQDGQLVFKTRVSTGKSGRETPSGSFSAKSKQRMHYSSLYENAPMPYSVQINGNYFMHGFSSVPHYPASHGCIRLPMNAAPAFYNWVEPGTPIRVTGSNPSPKSHAKRHWSTADSGRYSR